MLAQRLRLQRDEKVPARPRAGARVQHPQGHEPMVEVDSTAAFEPENTFAPARSEVALIKCRARTPGTAFVTRQGGRRAPRLYRVALEGACFARPISGIRVDYPSVDFTSTTRNTRDDKSGVGTARIHLKPLWWTTLLAHYQDHPLFAPYLACSLAKLIKNKTSCLTRIC